MTRLQRNSRVSETLLGEEIFLVTPGTGEVYYLDAVTSGLWRYLAEARTLAECQATFRDAFPDQPAKQIERDIAAAVGELERRKLILPEG
jgi:hypothetical protein